MRTILTILSLIVAHHAMADMLPMDAVVFKNSDPSSEKVGRVDLLAGIPFQLLRFSEKKGYYSADFQAVIRIEDTTGTRVLEDVLFETAKAKDYYSSQGGTGGFFPLIKRFPVDAGIYTIELSVQDGGGKIISFAKKKVSVVDFDDYEQTLSGLMLLSSVEEIDGRMKITPHLSDNIYELDEGFSVFFQAYSKEAMEGFMDWELIEEGGKAVMSGNMGLVELQEGTTQQRIYIDAGEELPLSKLIMRVYLRAGGPSGEVLAAADRTLNNLPSSGAEILTNMEEAVAMLAYVADASVIDSIENLENERSQQKAFLEFWDGLDPSPNTRRNEAFDEYFQRIEYANKTFNSYASGWLTDMGRVYIVLGPPDEVGQTTGMNTRIQQEVWIYNNMGRFVFQDRSGFGDFRLVEPMGFRRKYKYGSRDGR